MRKSATSGAIAAVLLCSYLQASAAVVTAFTGGTNGRSEQTCFSPVPLLFAVDCTVSGYPDLGLAFTDPQIGPLASGGFYATGTAPSPMTGSTPGDGKANLRYGAGTSITIDDAGTPGTATDDLISFTLVLEGGVRNTSIPGGASVNESFSSITHTLTNYLVDSASANGFDGFDYVIGSAGMMFNICTDDLPGQPGTGGCFGQSEYGSSLANSLSPATNVWTRPSVPGPWSQGPLPGNVNYGGAGLNNNVGAVVTSVIANYACVDAGGPDPDCASIDGVGEDGVATTWANNGAVWDNLIMTISVDAAGNVVYAKGYYVQMYDIILGGNNSWIGGSFTLGVPIPAAAWLFVSALALLGWMRRIAA